MSLCPHCRLQARVHEDKTQNQLFRLADKAIYQSNSTGFCCVTMFKDCVTSVNELFMVDKQKIAVYYNSACPVCNAGIESQKDKMANCPVDWKDVHSDSSLINEIDSELEFVRERLHVVDAEGNVLIGFDAFLEIWRNSPKEQWKADFFGLPIIRQISAISYKLFAAALYKWNRAKKHW